MNPRAEGFSDGRFAAAAGGRRDRSPRALDAYSPLTTWISPAAGRLERGPSRRGSWDRSPLTLRDLARQDAERAAGSSAGERMPG